MPKYLVGHVDFLLRDRGLYTTKFSDLVTSLLGLGYTTLYDTSRHYVPTGNAATRVWPRKSFKRLLGDASGQEPVDVLFFNFYVLRFPMFSQLFSDWNNLDQNVNIHAIYDEYEWSRSHLAMIAREAKIMRSITCFSVESIAKSRLAVNFIFNYAGDSMLVETVNPNPTPRVTLSGAVCNAYPGRQMAARLAVERPDQWETLPHASVDLGNKFRQLRHAVVGTSYRDFLADFLVGLTSPGISVINGQRQITLVSKHFEIMASGSLLLTSVEAVSQLRDLGFEPDRDFIVYQSDVENLQQKVDWVLDPVNRSTVDAIRTSGYQRVKEGHCSRHRALELDSRVSHLTP